MIGPIELPWPAKPLSPNTRQHWSVRSKSVKSARVGAFYTVRSACKTTQPWERVSVSMTFCPPDKRRRDRDNLIASMKAATDGIADALGVDDSKFEITYSISSPIKGGAVIVTLEEAPANER